MNKPGLFYKLLPIGLVISTLLGIIPLTKAQGAYNQRDSSIEPVIEANIFTVQVIPPLPGIKFALNGEVFQSNQAGLARIKVPQPGTYKVDFISAIDENDRFRAEFKRWEPDLFNSTRMIDISETTHIQAGFEVTYPIDIKYSDLSGQPVNSDRVDSVTMKSSNGAIYEFGRGQKIWLQKNRIARRLDGIDDVDLVYAIQNIVIDGSNVVNQGQQRFEVTPGEAWQIKLLLYNVSFVAKEAFLGFPLGNGVEIKYPDDRIHQYPFGPDRVLEVNGLARGTYFVRVVGAPGISIQTPVVLSRNQTVDLPVFSYLTIILAILVPITGATALLVIGRLRFRWVLHRETKWLILFLISALCLFPWHRAYAHEMTKTPSEPIPVFAYYYIWFDEGSWERGKIDYPVLGRYSSDDKSVMLKHIQWAKQAGIDGFIVSWKSTDKLNPRLEQLIELSEKENFKLMVIYQGLSYDRKPRPIRQVENDFDYFIKNFASSSAFDVFGKPVIIWNGTWKYSLKDIKTVTSSRRQHLLILATQKNVKDYLSLANLVDGDAYYWSSVNPYHTPNYQAKLDEMGKAVHDHGGIWIPSAASGFDARKIGGRRVVPRKNGETLQILIETAIDSSPDIIGLISWNEFSENTHIEPSQKNGLRYLEVLTNIFQSPPLPVPPLYDSDEPYPIANKDPTGGESMTGNTPLRLGVGRVSSLLFLTMLIGASLIILFVRQITRN